VNTNLRAASDEELTATVAGQRSDAACEELFRRYQQKIYLWCYTYTHDVDEAIDLTQEIFVKIFDNISGFAGRSRFSTWVYRVARNHCLSALDVRRDHWRRRQVALDRIELVDESNAERVRKAELRDDLDVLLAAAGKRMKDDELEAFVLHHRDGLTVNEITKVLGCTNATGARALIQNARRKFQRMGFDRMEHDG